MRRWVLSLLLVLPLTAANVRSARIVQLDYYLAGTLMTPRSGQGEFHVSYDQDAGGITFLNLVQVTPSGNLWLVRNHPLLSTSETGTLTFTSGAYINLGVPDGTDLTGSTVNYFYTTSPVPVADIPVFGLPGSLTVESGVGQINSGVQGGPNNLNKPPDFVKVNAPPGVTPTGGWHKGMPNVHTPLLGCSPAALTNSLQWLASDNDYKLNQTPEETLAELLKTAKIDNAKGGVAQGDLVGAGLKYAQDHNLPVEIHYFGGAGKVGGANGLDPKATGYTDTGGAGTAANSGKVAWSSIVQELQKGQNVLLMTNTHAVAVEGWVEAGDLRFLLFRDDPVQGQALDEAGKAKLNNRHMAAQFADKLNDGSLADPPFVNIGNGSEQLFTVVAESPKPKPISLLMVPQSGHQVFNFTNLGMGSGDFIRMPNGDATFFAGGRPMFDVPTMVYDPSTNTWKGTGPDQIGGISTVGELTEQSFFTAPNGLLQFNVLYRGGLDGAIPIVTFPGVGFNIFPLVPQANTNTGIFGEPIAVATGELFTELPPDLSLGGPLPLTFTRYYGSLLKLNGIGGALGANWMHNFDARVAVKGAAAGVVRFRGEVIRFLQKGSGWALERADRRNYQLVNASAGFRFTDPMDALIYTFSSTGALTRIEDRNGNALTVTQGASGPTQVSDGLGRTLTFNYTSDGRLSMVQDQSGRSVSFAYAGSDMTSATDAAGKITSYSYTTAGRMTSLISRVTRPQGNTTMNDTYDGNGRVTRQADGRGNTLSIVYSPTDFGVQTVRDARGNVTTLFHQNLTNLVRSTDAAGATTITTIDGNDRPDSMVDRTGAKRTTVFHDPSGLPASVTDGDGNKTSYTYSVQTQNGLSFYVLTGVTYADGTAASFSYDANGNRTKATDAAGKSVTYTYNLRGQVLTATNELGGVTTYTYNNDGTAAGVKSPAGDAATFSYDGLKRLAGIKYADGTSQAFVYDALDGITKATDERGKNIAAAYTDNGYLKTLTSATGGTSTLAYDANDSLAGIVDENGKTTKYQYNEVAQVQSATGPSGETATITYNALNRPVGIDLGGARARSVYYDPEGRVSGIADGAARVWTITRDRVGRQVALTTPAGETFSRTLDALGRVTAATDALGRTSRFTYDARGLATGVAMPGGVQAAYSRDDAGQVIAATDPNGGAWLRKFDSTGRLSGETDPLGRAVTMTFDSRNRPAGVTTPEGTAAFTYDAAGNLIRRLYSDSTDIKFGYDDANRLVQADGLTLGYDAAGRIVSSNGLAVGRDASGRIASIAYAPGKSVTYTYNAQGLLANVADWAGGSVSFTYNAALLPAAITRSNGTATQLAYDVNRRLSSIQENAGASITLQRDAAGRVVSADRTAPTAPSPAPGFLGLSYDTANQISAAAYDGLGRITSDTLRSYTWDLAGRLTAYAGATGSAAFTYDGLGGRISRTGPDGARTFVLNYAAALPGVAVVRTTDGDLRYYVHTPGGALLYSIEAADNTRHFYHFDETGSTVLLTDDSGAVTDSYGITPYGESVTANGATDNPFTWQGAAGVMQEPGAPLYYARARYYDSAAARFLSRDPVKSLAPPAMNPYQYAFGNPLRFSDPSGRSPADDFGLFSNFVVDPAGQSIDRSLGSPCPPGLLGGFPPVYCPGRTLTRGEMAVFIIRAKMNSVFPTSLNACPPSSTLAPVCYFPADTRFPFNNTTFLPIPTGSCSITDAVLQVQEGPPLGGMDPTSLSMFGAYARPPGACVGSPGRWGDYSLSFPQTDPYQNSVWTPGGR